MKKIKRINISFWLMIFINVSICGFFCADTAYAELNSLDHLKKVAIMENGRIMMDADSETLNNDLDIKEFYLGLTDDSRRKNYAEVKHYKRRKRWLS